MNTPDGRAIKFVTELHNRHKGQLIWIVGSDPTLDEYPDDFLDGKIGITLHLAALKFPNATYRYFNEYDRFKYLLEVYPDLLTKENIIAWPFFGRTKEESQVLTKRTGYYLILTSYPPYGKRGKIDLDFTEKKVVEAMKAKSINFGGHGTCLHACWYVAIMMGGNPINIIGCGFQAFDGKEHFAQAVSIDKEMRPRMPSFSNKGRSNAMREQTEVLIKACNRHGIIVNWIKNYE